MPITQQVQSPSGSSASTLHTPWSREAGSSPHLQEGLKGEESWLLTQAPQPVLPESLNLGLLICNMESMLSQNELSTMPKQKLRFPITLADS